MSYPLCNVGDVMFVARPWRSNDQIAYHHAGIVMEIDEANQPTCIIDFDPTFDGKQGSIFNAIQGSSSGKPRMLVGEELARVFNPDSCFVAHKASTDPQEVELILARINVALDKVHTYHLVTYNCQHFATEMQTGRGMFLDI